jgi:hypothetical protein
VGASQVVRYSILIEDSGPARRRRVEVCKDNLKSDYELVEVRDLRYKHSDVRPLLERFYSVGKYVLRLIGAY